MRSISGGLYLFLLIFAPLAFGTVELWSQTVLEIVTAAAFLLLSASIYLSKTTALRIPGMLPLLLLLGYMGFQLVPLPPAMVQWLSPAAFALHEPLLQLDPAGHIPLSVNRKATLLLLFTFTGYGLFYILTVYHCSRARFLKKTVIIVICLGVVIGIEAILQKLTSPDAVYWFRHPPHGSPVGPWVYSNHFAGFMAMLFPLTMALFLFYRPRVAYGQNFKEKVVAALTLPGTNSYLLLGTGAVLMAVSILFSVSRGGIITLSIAFLFFILFSARATGDLRSRWAAVLTILVILLVTWLGWQPITDKFGRLWGAAGLDTSGRLPVLIDSIRIFRAYPFFGSGFGTFINMYPAVRTVPGEAVFDHAHNDYIELLATGGLTGFLLCGWFVLSLLRQVTITLGRRREPYSILLTSGALTGILALLFHSLVDFQIYNGANGLYFFFLCGLAVSAANTRLQYHSSHTLLEQAEKGSLILPALLAVFLLAGSLVYKTTLIRADSVASSVPVIFLNALIQPDRLRDRHDAYSRAARLDPLEAEYSASLGRISVFLGEYPRARQEFLRACRLDPASGRFMQQLGMSLTNLDAEQQQIYLLRGIEKQPRSIDLYLNAGDWLLSNGRRREAMAVLTRAISAVPWQMPRIGDYLLSRQLSPDEIRRMLPPLAAAWHEIGRKFEQKGWSGEAEQFYIQALEHLQDTTPQPVYFSRLHHLLLKHDKETQAMQILRRAIREIPDYAPFRIMLGDYYQSRGIKYRARQEYSQALRLQPNNRTVQRKLEELGQE